jgi:hypothetical protein
VFYLSGLPACGFLGQGYSYWWITGCLFFKRFIALCYEAIDVILLNYIQIFKTLSIEGIPGMQKKVSHAQQWTLEENGWCPSLLFQMSREGASFLECFALPSNRNKDKGSFGTQYNCIQDECCANNVLTSMFQANHRAPYCGCDWIKLPISAIENILQND